MTVQTLAGILGLQDSERLFVEGIGQVQVFSAIQEYVAMINEDLARVSNLFIQGTTENYKFRYYLPADGYLQRKSSLGRTGESKVGGSWDVSLPLEGFGDALGSSQREIAYMTLADAQRALDGIALRAQNTLRIEILRALLDNGNYIFPDELRGDLTIRALANQDGTLFPALAGGTTAGQANHYGITNYAVSAISDTNNPIKTISRKLRSRFGANGTKRRRVVLISEDMQDYVEALPDFEEVNDPNIQKGANADQVTNIPVSIPGEIIGYCNEAYISVWPWMPPTYTVGIDLQAEKPLQMRVDPAYTNLPRGLVLKTTDQHNYPLSKSEWEWWFGLGVVNRLNGYVLQVATGGAYTVSTGYGH